MMKLKKFLKRITAFSLAVLMTVAAFPCNSVVHAAADDYPPEILFPINVLDFRADNLLFQYVNEWSGLNPGNNGIYLDLYQGEENNGGKGLVEDELGPDGVPVYKRETVERIAGYVLARLSLNDANSIIDRPVVNGETNYLSMRNYIRSKDLPKWAQIEAEDGVLANGATLGNNHGDCSNNAGVGNIGANNGNGSVTFTYNASQAGYRTIRLYYATAADRAFNVKVGDNTATVNAPATGGWWVPSANPVEVSMLMQQGENTITVSGNGDYAPNLDYIEIEGAYIYEAESFNMTGGATSAIDANCSGGAYLSMFGGDWNNRDSVAEYTFNWNLESGFYMMEIDYLPSNAWRDMMLTLNGTEIEICEQNNQWTRADAWNLQDGPIMLQVQLQQGANTIRFANYNGNPAMNMDCIRIYGSYPLGDYDESKKFFTEDMDPNTEGVQNTRGWTDITTCMDYAYFVTSNLFKYNASLNTQYDDYKQLVFHKVEDVKDDEEATGKTAYEFMADINHANVDLVYNKTKGTVRNVFLQEAEDGALDGSAVENGNVVGYIGGDGGGTVTFTYHCTQAGQYPIHLYYASNANRRYNVTVINSATGAEGVTVTTDPLNNGSWTNSNNTPGVVTADFVVGENTIIVSGVDGADAPNLDYIEIVDTIEGDEVRGGGSLFLADGADKGNLAHIDIDHEDEVYHEDHNFHYTVSSNSYFVYKEGAGQYFYFSGDDDVYVYVNNKLLVDLGGSHQQLDGEFNLDELAQVDEDGDGVNDYGLIDGEVVTLSFFYMERQTVASNFYAKLNFKLATDELKHVFDYQTIPYGHMANLTYSYKAMRELNTNTRFTFTDNFGNVFGADGFKLGDGVSLLNNTLVVTVKNADGTVDEARSASFQFENPNNPTSANDLATIEKLKEYFTNVKIERFESIEISGAQFDTATKSYDDDKFYTDVKDEYGVNSKVVTFIPQVEYDAWMEGATSPTTNTLTATNPVKVIVGSITIATAPDEDTDGDGFIDEVNLKKELVDYGAFTFTRTDTKGVTEICYTNDAAYGVSEITLDKLSLGDYTLTVDESVLTGYTVIINGKSVVSGTDASGQVVTNTEKYSTMNANGVNAKMLTIPFHPVYDANTKTWSYPEVRFELKATRDLPDLKDLT